MALGIWLVASINAFAVFDLGFYVPPDGKPEDEISHVSIFLDDSQVSVDLLDLENVVIEIGGITYTRFPIADPGSGVITSSFKPSGDETQLLGGYEYAVGKYDNNKGGALIQYLGGEVSTLPRFYDFGNGGGLKEISHIRYFNAVPEPATYIAALFLGVPFAVNYWRGRRQKS